MDAATLNDLTQMGFGIAAQNIGYAFNHYRPASALNPLAPVNLQGQLNAHFSVDPALKRWSTYDNPLFTALLDGRVCQAGDYLDHPTQGTYFLATLSTSPGMPNMAVQCGRVVSVSRPTGSTASTALMSGWPASIVRKSARGVDEANLPGKLPNPSWEMLLPLVGGVNVEISDVVYDDMGRFYFVEQAEASDYGWRCQIKQIPQINDATVNHLSAVIAATGKTITFRHVVTTGGANPTSNPVMGNISIAAAGAVGDAAVTLSAPIGNWFLEAGDILSIGGSVYTVQARTVAAGGKFTAVPISPALSSAVASGAPVSAVWVNDYPCKASITSYDAKLIDATTITVRDVRVTMQTVAADGRVLPRPVPVDRVIIDGQARSVGIVNALYCGESVAAWEVQAKG